MKKTLIALAIAAVASTAANATVVYQKDGTKIDIDGRLHFELANTKDNRTDLRDVGSRLRFRAYQEIGAGFSAYAGAELRFSKGYNDGSADSIGGDFRTHRLYAGFINPDIGTLTFGRQLHLGDHVPKSHYSYEWGGNSLFDAHRKAATFMSAKFNGFRFAVDYYFGDSDKSQVISTPNTVVVGKDSKGKDITVPTGKTTDTTHAGSSGVNAWDQGQGYGVGLFYDGKLGDFDVRFGSAYTEVTQSADGTKAEEFKLKRGGVGFDVKYNIVTLGFDWAFGKADKNKETTALGFQKIVSAGGPFNKLDRFSVGLKVDVTPQNAIYSNYYFGTGKKADRSVADAKMRGWMIGADHRFNKHVAVYVEGGQGKVKRGGIELKKNHRVLVGARIMF